MVILNWWRCFVCTRKEEDRAWYGPIDWSSPQHAAEAAFKVVATGPIALVCQVLTLPFELAGLVVSACVRRAK